MPGSSPGMTTMNGGCNEFPLVEDYYDCERSFVGHPLVSPFNLRMEPGGDAGRARRGDHQFQLGVPTENSPKWTVLATEASRGRPRDDRPGGRDHHSDAEYRGQSEWRDPCGPYAIGHTHD